MKTAELIGYGAALLFLIGGIVFVLIGQLVNKIIAPSKPNPEKLTGYECGEEPVGSSWVQFNTRFYVMGLIFLVFDVEILLLFPYALVFSDKRLIETLPGWHWLTLFEVIIFVIILAIGLIWIWAKGDIDWVKPQPIISTISGPVPDQLYQRFNELQKLKDESIPGSNSKQKL